MEFLASVHLDVPEPWKTQVICFPEHVLHCAGLSLPLGRFHFSEVPGFHDPSRAGHEKP